MKSLDKKKTNNLPSDVRNKVVKPNKPKELDMSKGVWGKTPDGVWQRALEIKTIDDYFYYYFRYDQWNNKLQRRIIRKGVETWINATDKQILKFIKQTLTQQRTELLEEIKKEVKDSFVKADKHKWNNEANQQWILYKITNLLNKKDE